jgi:hypothetical protein
MTATTASAPPARAIDDSSPESSAAFEAAAHAWDTCQAGAVTRRKSNQIKSNQSNQIKSIKSNQIKSNQIKSNQSKSNQIKSNQVNRTPREHIQRVRAAPAYTDTPPRAARASAAAATRAQARSRAPLPQTPRAVPSPRR